MQDLPAETPKDVATRPGFTVVEDDDVSFGIALCREIHRMYGMYMAGELPAADSVQQGLMLTMEMFSTLQNSVTDGMPALRLQVGAAQAREMLGTLFGHDLPTRRSRELAADERRTRPHRTSRSLASHTRHSIDRAPVKALPGTHNELVEKNPAPLVEEATVEPEAPPTAEPRIGAPPAAPSRSRRLTQYWESQYWASQPLVVQVAATLIGIVLAALLIDAPFVIVALWPNYLFPLTAAFIGLFVASKQAYRINRSGRGASR